jgi:hypothetical protein
MPRAATALVGKAMALRCDALRIRSTYAAALVPGVRRDGELGTVHRESVAVRLRGPGGGGFIVWETEDGASWSLGARRFSIMGRGYIVPAMVRSAKMPADAYLIDEALHDLCSPPELAPAAPDDYVPTRRERPAFIGVPRDRWFATSTPLYGLYPCRCHEPTWRPGYYCGYRCPCWGRPDLAGVPAHCCALRRIIG